MSAYPESMRYFLDEVNGASFNVFKLEPQNSNAATSNRILRFTLPSNSLLNLRSFQLYFNMSANGTAAAGGRLPAGIDRVVQRMEVSCGGVQLSAGSNFYNVLQEAKRGLEGNDLDGQLSHPDCVRQVSYVDNNGVAVDADPVLLANLANETYSSANNDTQFCISKWDGFLGSAMPSILDSALVPDIVISIFLDDDSILGSTLGTYLHRTGAAAGPPWDQSITSYSGVPATWGMENIHATIECVGLSDGVLDSLEASIIAQEGSLRVPFKQYFSFQDTTSNTMRFNVATGSLDRVWIAHRDNYYSVGNAAGLKLVQGNKITSEAGRVAIAPVGAPAILLAKQDAGIAQYDAGGSDVVDNNHEQYQTQKFKLSEPPPAVGQKQRYQLSLNASFYPQFQATFEEMLGISRNSVQRWREDHISLFTQKSNYSAQVCRFCLPETGVRTISGFDTRSVSLNGYYNMYNMAGQSTVTLFCECTSVLRIGEARQLEVVQ